MNKEERKERISYAKSNFTDGIEIFLEIIEKLEFELDITNKVIDEMAETICIYRGYAITKSEDIQTLKDRVIQEYFKNKVEEK